MFYVICDDFDCPEVVADETFEEAIRTALAHNGTIVFFDEIAKKWVIREITMEVVW